MCEKLYESIKRNLAQGGITQLGFREDVHVAAALTQPPNLPRLCSTLLCTTGADPGGTPKLHKEWINVARMRANTLRFSTQQLPGPPSFRNPVSTPAQPSHLFLIRVQRSLTYLIRWPVFILCNIVRPPPPPRYPTFSWGGGGVSAIKNDKNGIKQPIQLFQSNV